MASDKLLKTQNIHHYGHSHNLKNIIGEFEMYVWNLKRIPKKSKNLSYQLASNLNKCKEHALIAYADLKNDLESHATKTEIEYRIKNLFSTLCNCYDQTLYQTAHLLGGCFSDENYVGIDPKKRKAFYKGLEEVYPEIADLIISNKNGHYGNVKKIRHPAAHGGSINLTSCKQNKKPQKNESTHLEKIVKSYSPMYSKEKQKSYMQGIQEYKSEYNDIDYGVSLQKKIEPSYAIDYFSNRLKTAKNKRSPSLYEYMTNNPKEIISTVNDSGKPSYLLKINDTITEINQGFIYNLMNKCFDDCATVYRCLIDDMRSEAGTPSKYKAA